MQSSPYSNTDIEQRAGYLISGYLSHALTKEEEEELDSWISSSEENMRIFEELTEENTIKDYRIWNSSLDTETALDALKRKLRSRKRKIILRNVKFLAAAVIISVLAYVFLGKSLIGPKPKNELPTANNLLQPAKPQAILTLDDGSVVRLYPGLDTMLHPGIVIKNGSIKYLEKSDNDKQHSLLVPAAGFYTLFLSDGTRVLLNSGSSIMFPESFSRPRRVILIGEALFEVQSDERNPFIVQMGQVEFKAIGTKFNIRQYKGDSSVIATLLEGSLVVKSQTQEKIMRPGQMLTLTNNEWELQNLYNATDNISWAQGEFRFRDKEFHAVMEELARWYDAKIVYNDNINFHFNGTFHRTLPLPDALNLLEQTGQVHFVIDGKTVMVYK